jgi:hypothetical protein
MLVDLDGFIRGRVPQKAEILVPSHVSLEPSDDGTLCLDIGNVSLEDHPAANGWKSRDDNKWMTEETRHQ